VTREVIMIRK